MKIINLRRLNESKELNAKRQELQETFKKRFGKKQVVEIVEREYYELSGQCNNLGLTSLFLEYCNKMEIVHEIAAKDAKKFDYVKLKPNAKKVYQKDDYCRFNKAFIFVNVDDISDTIELKGNKIVYTDFTY